MRQREIETLNDSVEKNHPDHLEELPKKKISVYFNHSIFSVSLL